MSDETTQNSNVIKAEPVTPVPAVQLELLQIILKAILSEPAKYILISGSVAQFVGNFGLIFALRKFFYGFLVEWRCCGRKSLVFDRMGARAKARRLAPLLV